MSVFNAPITELTTAATDAAMAVISILLLTRLRRLDTGAPFGRQIWSWVFVLLAVASALGAVAHGFAIPDQVRALLWLPLYLSLGLAIGLFLVGAVHDWSTGAAARRMLPWAIATGVGFFAVSQLLGGAFILFVLYEAAAMLLALALYVGVAVRTRSTGAWMVTAGIALTLLAAALQATTLQAVLVVPFDHNGLFHLVQIAATVVLAGGIRRLLARR